MIVKHSEIHDSLHLSLSMKHFFTSTLFTFLLLFSVIGHAESPTVYGPTKSGETLWKIARSNLPNNAISIEQLAYTIYATNPKAFQSGNINFLLKGVSLTIPNIETISKTSTDEALKRIEILQFNAKKIAIAKANSKKFNKQIRRYQRQLNKSRRNSKAWKRAYRKLSRSKRNLAVSKREITHLSRILQDTTVIEAPNSADQNKPLVATTNNNADNPNTKLEKTSKQKPTQANSSEKAREQAAKVAPSTKKMPETVQANTQQNLAVRQGKLPSQNTSNKSPPTTNWWALIKKNYILIGAFINGLILLFVLFKLFEKEDESDYI